MSRYIPFPAYYDDMPVDISFVFRQEKPAGKHGFMKASGSHFAFEDGTPARFWGVNFNGGACFPEFDYSEKVARRLAKAGVNIVRFHQLDAEWNTPNIFSFSKGERIGSTLELHPESMKRLDYLVKCLKDEGIFSTWNDPAKFGLFYHAALIARRGDVKEAPTSYAVRVTELAGKNYQLSGMAGAAEYTKTGVCFDGVESGQADKVFAQDEKLVDLEKGEITSITGEMYRSWKKNYGTIDTERTKVAYGFLGKNGEIRLNGMGVASETDFAVVALSSLTDAPIESSDNMLLTTVGRARNTDARFEGEQMYDYGKPPITVEVIETEISIRTQRKDLICWAVNAEGYFTGKVPARYEDGCFKISLGKTMPSMYYLIQAE